MKNPLIKDKKILDLLFQLLNTVIAARIGATQKELSMWDEIHSTILKWTNTKE